MITIELQDEHALELWEVLKEFCYLGQSMDADAFSDKNMETAENVKAMLMRKLTRNAQTAVANMLSDTDQVLFGNGVSPEGEMYEDVKDGLETAALILSKAEIK